MPVFRAGQTVTFVSRKVTGQDDYGNDVYTEVSQFVSGCAIAPSTSSEDVQGTASVLTDVILYAPTNTDIGLFDAVILPDGKRYRLTGTPNTWQSPFTGSVSYVQINLQAVTGAMEQFPRGQGAL